MTVRVNKESFNLREKLSELERPIGLKGSELMKSETAQEARDFISAGRKNLIINGDMRVSQRGTSFTINGSSGVSYTLDRFRLYHGNVASTGTVTQSSSNGLDYFKNSLKFECTGGASSVDAGDDCWIRYIVETKDLPADGWPAGGQSMTLSFWARSNQAGRHSVAIASGNFGQQHYNHAYQLDNNVWKHVKLTVPAPYSFPVSGDAGLRIYWPLAVGSTYQTSTVDQWIYNLNDFAVSGAQQIQGVAGATFEITGVQLEVGENATEFEHRSYGEELALCQRYYEKFSANCGNGGYATFMKVSKPSNTLLIGEPVFRVPKRAPGATLTFGGSMRISNVEEGETQVTLTGVQNYQLSTHGGYMVLTMSNNTHGNGDAFRLEGRGDTSAYMAFSSEF